MRRAELAEAILSLAASRERAASMAGDLLEDDPGAFHFWFWVGRTATAQAWRQLTAKPTALAGIVIRAMMAELGYSLAACLLYLLLLLAIMSILQVCFHTDIHLSRNSILQWPVLDLLVPFCVGRWITRRFGERAAAGSLALAMLHTAINLFVGLILLEGPRIGLTAHLDVILGLKLLYWHEYGAVLRSAILYATLYPAVLLAGAATFRISHSGPDLA
jgi:hypothetical protein